MMNFFPFMKAAKGADRCRFLKSDQTDIILKKGVSKNPVLYGSVSVMPPRGLSSSTTRQTSILLTFQGLLQ